MVFVSIASMALGSFAAIGQRNIKRLMAYSSIGHMGFALVGLAAGTAEGAQGVLVYLAIYVAMTLGSFAIILAMKRNGQAVEQISDFAGLSRTNPLLAFFFAMFLFSLAGVPPLAGFFAKFYVFVAAIKAGLFTLAVIGVLTSVVGAFYYLSIVKVMYFDEPLRQARSGARRAAHGAGGDRASSTSCSSSIRGRWSARRRPRRNRCSRCHSTLGSASPAIARGYRLVAFDQIGSTNAEAMARARDGERGPIWFVTTEQTAGRGRRQRPWIAPRGNLASSILEVMRGRAAGRGDARLCRGPGAGGRAAQVSVEAALRQAGNLLAEMAE